MLVVAILRAALIAVALGGCIQLGQSKLNMSNRAFYAIAAMNVAG